MEKKARVETGQTKQSSPTMLLDGDKIITKPRQIATALNRQYIATIRDTIANIPETDQDPLILYKKYIGPVESKLNLEQFSMNQMVNTIRTMSSTTSSAPRFPISKTVKGGRKFCKSTTTTSTQHHHKN